MECLARGHDVLHCEARCHMKIFVMLLRVLDSFKLSFDLKSFWDPLIADLGVEFLKC